MSLADDAGMYGEALEYARQTRKQVRAEGGSLLESILAGREAYQEYLDTYFLS